MLGWEAESGMCTKWGFGADALKQAAAGGLSDLCILNEKTTAIDALILDHLSGWWRGSTKGYLHGFWSWWIFLKGAGYWQRSEKKFGLVGKRKRSGLDIARNVTMNIRKQHALQAKAWV